MFKKLLAAGAAAATLAITTLPASAWFGRGFGFGGLGFASSFASSFSSFGGFGFGGLGFGFPFFGGLGFGWPFWNWW